MATPPNERAVAPSKTPGFAKGLFGYFSSSKPTTNDQNSGNRDRNDGPTTPTIVNRGMQNPRTLFVNNVPDLISGTPQINRREVAPQQSLSVRNNTRLGIKNSSVKRKATSTEHSTTFDSPWIPRSAIDSRAQIMTSTQPPEVSFQIGLPRRDVVNRLATDSRTLVPRTTTNGTEASSNQSRVSTTTYRYKPSVGYRVNSGTNGIRTFRKGTTTQSISKQVAEQMREAMNQFQPHQVLLSQTTANSATGYKHFTSSGRLFSRRSRFRPLPTNAAVVITGNKHTMDQDESIVSTKRQRVTFDQPYNRTENTSSSFATPPSVNSSPSKAINRVEELMPLPSLNPDFQFDGIPTKILSTKSLYKGAKAKEQLTTLPSRVPVALFTVPSECILSKKPVETKKVVVQVQEVKPADTSLVEDSQADQLQKKTKIDGSGWGEVFASQKKLWKCRVCLSQNEQELLKCPACETERDPDGGSTANTSMADTKASNPITSAIGKGGFVFNATSLVNKPGEQDRKTLTPSIGSIGSNGFTFGVSTVSKTSSEEGKAFAGESTGYSFGVSSTTNNVTTNEQSKVVPAFLFGTSKPFSPSTQDPIPTQDSSSCDNSKSEDNASSSCRPPNGNPASGISQSFPFATSSEVQESFIQPSSSPPLGTLSQQSLVSSSNIGKESIVSNIPPLPFAFGANNNSQSAVPPKSTFLGFNIPTDQEKPKSTSSEQTMSNVASGVKSTNFPLTSESSDGKFTHNAKLFPNGDDRGFPKADVQTFQFGQTSGSTSDKGKTENQNGSLLSSSFVTERPAPATVSSVPLGTSVKTSEGFGSTQKEGIATDSKAFGFEGNRFETPAPFTAPSTSGASMTQESNVAASVPFAGFGSSVAPQPTVVPTPASGNAFVFGATSAPAPAPPQPSFHSGVTGSSDGSQKLNPNSTPFNSQNGGNMGGFSSGSTATFGSLLPPSATSFGTAPIATPALPPLFGNASSGPFGQTPGPAPTSLPTFGQPQQAAQFPSSTTHGDFSSSSSQQLPVFGSFQQTSSGFGAATQAALPAFASPASSGFSGGFASQPSGQTDSFQIGVVASSKAKRRIVRAKRPPMGK